MAEFQEWKEAKASKGKDMGNDEIDLDIEGGSVPNGYRYDRSIEINRIDFYTAFLQIMLGFVLIILSNYWAREIRFYERKKSAKKWRRKP